MEKARLVISLSSVILKVTKVDGVYSADPNTHKKAKKFTQLKYIDLLKRRLRVMDATAVSLCMDHKLPIVIFSLAQPGNIKRVILGSRIGTVIH